jgi:MAE_28990/MAE_18760-like HEPN
MSEPRTLTSLYECIDKEYKWRITELSNYRTIVLANKDNAKAQTGLIRAGVALLYAHWEGFIKKIADLYYAFVGYQNCTIGELSDCFISIALRSEIEQLQSSKKIKIHNEIVHTFFERKNRKANFSATSPIKTANLNYEIFEDVCLMIGIDINQLHERYKRKGYDRNFEHTINKDLLEKRNFIAHGDYLHIKEKEYKELYDVIINGILFNFKELVMDCARQQTYKRKNNT